MASTGVKCDDCGATNSESARFCAECGESLD
ncbi:MAG: putative OB-fold protein, partial [Planctomycetota bacterium]